MPAYPIAGVCSRCGYLGECEARVIALRRWKLICADCQAGERIAYEIAVSADRKTAARVAVINRKTAKGA